MKKARFPGKAVFVAALLLMGFVLLSAFAPSIVAAKDPVTVGVVHSLSGPGGVFGQWYRDGSVLAMEEINEAGGIMGRPLKLIFRDDKCSPETGLREAKELVIRKNVDFLSGSVVSSIGLAVSRFARERKKLYIVSSASDKAIMEEQGHRYVFRVGGGTRALAYAPAYYMKDLPYTKFWIMGPDYAYGHSMGEMFMEKIKELNPKAEKIGESWPKFGTTDFTPYITAIMAAKPDVLFSSVWGSDWVAWLKQAKPMGFHEKILEVGGEKGQIENLVPGGEYVPEGLIGAGPFPWWDSSLETDDSKAFLKKVYDRTGNPYPSSAVQFGYITMHALKRAVEKAGSTDTEKVIDALVGLEINWMIGENGVPCKSKVRALDHHFGGPVPCGVAKKVKEYPFAVTLNSKMYSGDQIYPSEEQIRKARGQ